MAHSYFFAFIGQIIPYSILFLGQVVGGHTVLFADAVESSFFYNLMGKYGLYAVFFLTMWEGDITLLLAGVFAHHGIFGDYGYALVLRAGTLGGVVGDSLAYSGGRGFERS